MNLWNSLEVNPAVLVSGTTGCGKSTVAALLKKML
jgi:broad-specificity NMP kinase